jgi:hypothetical protein
MPHLIPRDQIVHVVILPNYAITASGYDEIGKNNDFYVSVTTSFIVTSITVIDGKIKLM